MNEDPKRRAEAWRVVQFAETARRMAAERAMAANTVEPLLKHTPIHEWSDLRIHPDLLNAGALECLSRIITSAQTRDLSYALRVAELAVDLAGALPENAYPGIICTQLRAHAWKDLGKSLRLLARYGEAEKAFLVAETEVSKFGALAHDLAVVQLNQAVLLQETSRYDESRLLLGKCKPVFREHGDTDTFVQATLIEAVLLQRLRRYREAREAHLLLLASIRDLSKDNLAALHLAIGYCSTELGEYAEADANLQHALSIYRSLGQSTNALKAQLGQGKLLLKRGDFANAITYLRSVRRDFLRNALIEEAGLCGLDIVEALLVLKRAGEAEQLSRKIVHEFSRIALNRRVLTALSYLSEAIAAKRASASMAHEVHEYILSLRETPEREFVEQPMA